MPKCKKTTTLYNLKEHIKDYLYEQWVRNYFLKLDTNGKTLIKKLIDYLV